MDDEKLNNILRRSGLTKGDIDRAQEEFDRAVKLIPDINKLMSGSTTADEILQKTYGINFDPKHYQQYYDDLLKYKLEYLESIKEFTDLAKRIPTLENTNPKKDKLIAELQAKEAKTYKFISRDHLLNQLDKSSFPNEAQTNKIIKLFDDNKQPSSFFVLSIDIRRSTELMLRANEASSFESFITDLCEILKSIITINYGVFDKFTGDGVLGFFPLFYSGESAGYYAIKSTVECHEAFGKHYKECRDCFSSVILDTGLGIGIDYGTCHMANINGLTLIGRPVVYACRLNAAEAGTTLLNQAAYTHIKEKYPDSYSFSETEINAKYEEKILAYKLDSYKQPNTISKPDWTSNNDKSNNNDN